MIARPLNARATLDSVGFALVRREDFQIERAVGRPTALIEAWENLEPDPYVTQREDARRRRHGEFSFDPDTGHLERLPSRAYVQASESSSLYGGVERHFAPIEEATADDTFFRALVLHDALLVAPPGSRPLHIHVHLVRITATAGADGDPSPEGMHRDGFDHIAIHVISRSSAMTGGVTTVSDDDGSILAECVLSDFMDSLYADDRRVLHATSPVRTDSARAHRDVLLLSFQQLSSAGLEDVNPPT